MHLKRREEMDTQALSELEELAKQYRDTSLSDASRRAYRADWTVFESFCELYGARALPATSQTICAYISNCAEQGKNIHTIVRSLTSINKAHELAGFPPVRDPLVRATLRGIRRSLGSVPDKARAISYFEVLRMADSCEPSVLGVRDKAILLMGWCSALRRSELVALNIGDLEFSEKGVIVTIRRSKTDQEGEGSRIAIPFAAGPLCAVKALERWIGRLYPQDKKPESPLFLSIGSGGRRRWYKKNHTGRLTPRMISIIVKKYAKIAGLPANRYSAHSLRRGLATEAGAAQIPERVIARHTRHRSVDVLRGYIEDGNIWDENPLGIIYATGPAPVPSSAE